MKTVLLLSSLLFSCSLLAQENETIAYQVGLKAQKNVVLGEFDLTKRGKIFFINGEPQKDLSAQEQAGGVAFARLLTPSAKTIKPGDTFRIITPVSPNTDNESQRVYILNNGDLNIALVINKKPGFENFHFLDVLRGTLGDYFEFMEAQ